MIAIADAGGRDRSRRRHGRRRHRGGHRDRDVLLEGAYWDPRRIRRTRRALGMSTEASYRFERGIDRWGGADAMRRCIELVLATAGGSAGRRAARPLARAVAPAAHLPPAGARGPGARRRAALGTRSSSTSSPSARPWSPSRTTAASRWTCRAGGPTSSREIDLIEEIARLHGYDSFPSDLRPFRLGSACPTRPSEAAVTRCAAALVAEGLYEVARLPLGTGGRRRAACAWSTRSPPTTPGSAGGCCPGWCAWSRRNWANHVAGRAPVRDRHGVRRRAARRAPARGAAGRRRAHRPARAGPLERRRQRAVRPLGPQGPLRGRGRSGDSRWGGAS